jgi:hypothetical protein
MMSSSFPTGFYAVHREARLVSVRDCYTQPMETGTSGREKRPPSALGSAGLPQLMPRQAEPTEGSVPTGRRPLFENGLALGTFDDGSLAYLSDLDRRRPTYIVGKTGTGKSTAIHTMMLSDLESGRGFALLDPHGDLAEQVADCVPEFRFNDVAYVDPSDPTHCLGFNPLHNVAPDNRPLVAAHVVATFAHIWNLSLDVAPRLTYILYNSVRLLLDAPGSTLLGLQKLLVDDVYRAQLLTTASDPAVRAFWEDEFGQLSDRDAALAVSSLQNKVGMLLAGPLRNILGQVTSTINIRRLMDDGGVLIVNLNKGRLGEGPTHVLGAFLATAFAQAAESRADIPEEDRRDFTLYADEFQNFATDSFASTLSESRKWRLNLVLSHQFLGQLPTVLRQAVIGNAGSIIAFRIGGEDADTLHLEMQNRELVYDYTKPGFINIAPPIPLTNTANFSAWLKLLENGEPTETRLAYMDAPRPDATGRLDAVRSRSRARYLRPRTLVERKINRFLDSRPRDEVHVWFDEKRSRKARQHRK